MPVRVNSDKRFRRVQVKPGRRRGGWRGRAWPLLGHLLVIAAICYGGYRAAALVRSAPALAVDNVLVRGNQRMSESQVVAAVEGLRHQNILLLDLETWRQRLLASPWIEEAVLRRVLPSTIEVLVSERHPIGIARLGARLFLVDAGGVIIDEHGPQYAQFDLPIIDGLGSGPADPGLAVDPGRAGLAARLLAQVGRRRDLLRRLSQIDVSDTRDAVVILDGDSALVHIGDQRFLERLLSYLELLPALKQRVPAIDYVDMRFDERVYVKPTGGALTRAVPTAPSRGSS